MVALAILALSGIALLTNVNQAAVQLGRLDEKIVALNIAEYALNSVLLKEEYPETGSDEEMVTLADRDWRVEITISDTPNEDVRRIDVLVSPYDLQSTAKNDTTILLSGFQADIF